MDNGLCDANKNKASHQAQEDPESLGLTRKEIEMFNNVDVKDAIAVAATDVAHGSEVIDSPTTIPCGITISIVLGC